MVGVEIQEPFLHEMGELAVQRAARLAAEAKHVGEAHRPLGERHRLQHGHRLAERAGAAVLVFPLPYRHRRPLLLDRARILAE